MKDNQQKFYDACNEVRKMWGLKSSTFEQVSNLLSKALSASLQPGVDQKTADIHIDALWHEWTKWRAMDFLLQERKQVSATLSRWPRGRHYHVSLIGDGVNIFDKFNTPTEAEKFLNRHIRRLRRQGREVIDSRAVV